MSTAQEKFSATHKAAVESALTVMNTLFANFERISALNLNTSRSIIEESIQHTKNLLAAKDAQALTSLQMSAMQPMMEKVVAYQRSVYEITSQSQEEISKVIEGHVAEFNKNLSVALDKAAQSAPAGSDVAVAAVKSAIAAANSAYDSMNRAVKQAAEIAEANVNAATDATVKAVNTSATTTTSSTKSSRRAA